MFHPHLALGYTALDKLLSHCLADRLATRHCSGISPSITSPTPASSATLSPATALSTPISTQPSPFTSALPVRANSSARHTPSRNTGHTLLRVIATVCLWSLCASSQAAPHDSPHDSLLVRPAQPTIAFPSPRIERSLDKIASSRLFQITYAGVPLIVGGLIIKGEDNHFRALRNDYLPSFNRHLDNYLQYTPAAVMLGLKIGGVQGRSTWGRMLLSDLFSSALMAGTVNALKYSTLVMRPDGSNRHSFPSGHTATAFMTATMLNKEYGYRNPWIEIGGYTVAAATGLMRSANNKHWLSDIFTGAGIGVISTELGYYLADLIFHDKSAHPVYTDELDRMRPPSFIGLYLGFNVPLSHYDLNEHLSFKSSSGCTAGLEGAYFFNPYIGIGGRGMVSNTRIIMNDIQSENNTFDLISAAVGPYFSYPLSKRWQIGSKLLVGFVHYPPLTLSRLSVGAHNGFGVGSGLSLTFRANDCFGFRLLFDYNLRSPQSTLSKEYLNMLTLGSSFIVTL